jgi:hypothetical protein
VVVAAHFEYLPFPPSERNKMIAVSLAGSKVGARACKKRDIFKKKTFKVGILRRE